jgi:hypothetical protein
MRWMAGWMVALTRLDSSWSCQVCGDHGVGAHSDKHAEAHVKATGHATISRSRPREERDGGTEAEGQA